MGFSSHKFIIEFILISLFSMLQVRFVLKYTLKQKFSLAQGARVSLFCECHLMG